MTRPLKALLLFTDLGFLGYWLATATRVIPPEWAYSDAANPLIVTWNWSFFPLDITASACGLLGFALWRRRPPVGRALVLISLALTASSGLNALSFWALQGQFDALWWGANAFLLLWPLPFLVRLVRS